MKTEREALLVKLRMLKPAIATGGPIPILQCLWVAKDRSTAYNDIIAIQVPLEADFVGGLVGSPLLGLLESSASEGVTLIANGAAVALTAGGTKAKLPLLPTERCPFTLPVVKPEVPITAELLAALDFVMVVLQGVSSFTGAGVALVAESDTLTLYATDNTTLAWAMLRKPDKVAEQRFILSVPFCEQLLALGKEGGALFLDEQKAVATFADGSRLYGRLVEQKEPVDYAGVVKRFVPDPEKNPPVPLPEGLAAALDRAAIVAGGQPATIQCRIEKAALLLDHTGAFGELHERLALVKGAGDLAAANFDAGMLRHVLPKATDFLFTEEAFFLLGADVDGGYICAAVR